MTAPSTRVTARRGSALVEFSLTAFLLVMMVLSVIEMTRFLLVYTALDNAARAGARYAITHGHDRSGGSGADGESTQISHAQVDSVVKNFASTGTLNMSAMPAPVVNYVDGCNTVGCRVEVKATYLYDPFISWFTQLAGFTLQSTSRGVITY
jgi:Flp pilus assembly protein TadG